MKKRDNLIDQFERELYSKLYLKQLPNLTLEQSLVKFFKFFDLQNTGICYLKDWIKTIEKLGVYFSKAEETQEIFEYYDKNNTGYIDYKAFANEFCGKLKSTTKTNDPSFNKQKSKTGLDNFHHCIKDFGGQFILKLLKEIKLIDYKDVGRISKDDLINTFTKPLTSFNILELLQIYERNNSPFINYNDIFNDLKNFYINDMRKNLINNLYKQLKSNINRELKLVDVKNLFNPKRHPKVLKGYSEEEVQKEYDEMIHNYRIIRNYSSNNSVMSKEDFIEFLIIIGFGIEDSVFSEIINNVLINNIQSTGQKVIIKEPSDLSKLNSERNKSVNQVDNNFNEEFQTLIEKIRRSIRSSGKKTIFNLLKQFKFYDKQSGYINKSDFTKIIKEFRLNLTLTEIERAYEKLSEKNSLINYLRFIKLLTNEITSFRLDLIKKFFTKLGDKNSISLDSIKNLYNIKKEFEEFLECWLLFTNIFNKNKSVKNIQMQDFIEFYEILGVYHDSDEEFEQSFTKEWLSSFNSDKLKDTCEKKNEMKRSSSVIEMKRVNPENSKPNTSTGYIGIKTYNPILKFIEKLRKRGLRGLMNLHKQFLLVCNDNREITLDDFIFILKLQRIDLEKIEYENIFNRYLDKKSRKLALDFPLFIKELKKPLSGARLEAVENAFVALDINGLGEVPLNSLKLNIRPNKHPDVRSSKKDEEEVLCEMLDCFDLNNYFFTIKDDAMSESEVIVTFEEFANFYEYVSFLYIKEHEFLSVVKSHW